MDDRNPSRAFMIVGVFVALVLALAGAAVLYLYLQPQNKTADTRAISVTQMQPAQLIEPSADAAEEANARAAADKLLAESLNRQATQIAQAAQQAQPPTQQVQQPTQQVQQPTQQVQQPIQPAQQPTAQAQFASQAQLAAQATATPYADAANAAAAAPAAEAVQNVVDVVSTEPQSTGSTQTALLQPKAETVIQKNDIPAPPPVEPPKIEAPPPAPAPAALSADETRRLMARASTMIQQGDIASARLVLDRLARFGDARAAFALAETFDPRMLAQWNVRGIKPDSTRAKTFYSQAARAGIGEARDRLTELGN